MRLLRFAASCRLLVTAQRTGQTFVLLAAAIGLAGVATAQQSGLQSASLQQAGLQQAGSQQHAAPPASSTPTNFFERWQARATRIQSQQPRWIVPVVSPYPMLIQVLRTDVNRQIAPNLITNWNLGLSRGLNLIPFARTELDLAVPPYLVHGDTTPDGFGDLLATAKLRLLSANERHGNYLLTSFVTATFPTGSYKNGSTNATFTPGLSGGKGFGRFDAFTTAGVTLPTGNVKTLGRPVATNSVFQYHVQRFVWPELEVNTVAFYGGGHDGKIQSFLTPGLVLGNYKRHPKDERARLGLVGGIGFQTAATHFHLYNHNLVLTGRIIF